MGRRRPLRLLRPGNSSKRTTARAAKRYCERRGHGLNLPLRKLKTTCALLRRKSLRQKRFYVSVEVRGDNPFFGQNHQGSCVMKVGDQISVSGFITKEKFIAGRTLAEAEKILGFHAGRFSHGVAIAVLMELPDMQHFKLAAYSNIAAQ